MSKRNFSKVKVGDLVGSIALRGNSSRWTGTLHRVGRVAEKRFLVNSNWVDKASGMVVGDKSGLYYVPATAEMIADVERKNHERTENEKKIAVHRDRPDYKLAAAILHVLDDSLASPHNHPLDRLTLDEWQTFHDKLCGQTATEEPQ